MVANTLEYKKATHILQWTTDFLEMPTFYVALTIMAMLMCMHTYILNCTVF